MHFVTRGDPAASSSKVESKNDTLNNTETLSITEHYMINNTSYDLNTALKEKFDITSFRTHQKEIMSDILNGRDLLVLMPTGGGKSICYQLPALLSPGFTLIISPLIALIWDQVDDLLRRNIPAKAWSTDLSSEEVVDIKKSITDGNLKILYTTPEMLMQSSHLSNIIKTQKLDRVVIDEAHCVSNWGHEFRDSYLELVRLKSKFPITQIVAFTATATPVVQLDIIRILNMTNVKIYRQSYIRENLHYAVKKRESGGQMKNRVSESLIEEIYYWLRTNDYLHKSGIIYCLSRDNSENVAKALREKGLSAEHFHASIPVEEKKQTQARWLNGETKIIVATIAFALGINKPNVRFVIHAALPKSIEGYYQETGRAGRDGQVSRCLLLYHKQDKHILQKLSAKNNTAVTNPSQHKAPADSWSRTEDMFQWADSILDCRIQSLSRYLGENVIYSCGNCDNCVRKYNPNAKGLIAPIKRSVKDFLTAAIDYIRKNGADKKYVSKTELLNHLPFYSDYDKSRVFMQLEALGWFKVDYLLDREGVIHVNVSILRDDVENAKEEELTMFFPNGTLTNFAPKVKMAESGPSEL
jgi:RecQ family ATP-dependent DNA helicase